MKKKPFLDRYDILKTCREDPASRCTGKERALLLDREDGRGGGERAKSVLVHDPALYPQV